MKMYTRALYIPLVVLAGIIAVRLFFPFHVHIADAIALDRLPQYDVQVSAWRVVFEPALGLLLFFNRALYALREFPVVLYWLLTAFMLYTIWKAAQPSGMRDKRKFLLRQLARVPVLVALWFVLFVVILFIPLPNNTIINHSPGSILVNTHAHSNYSHDGLMTQEALWRWHRRNGYDAFFITDHNNHDRTLDFVRRQRNQELPASPLVMCGEEFSGSNHLSLLGLERKFSTRGFADSTAIDSVRANGGAVIVNHWFDDEKKSLEYYRDLGVDGFEIENTATDRVYDRSLYQRMKAFCMRNGLLMVGGVDFHGYGNACSLWNAFEIPDWPELDQEGREAAILDILRSRDQAKVTVLQYRDRPYYGDEDLWISPLRTIFYYFRTLRWHQVVSWAFWLLVTGVLVRAMTAQRQGTHWLSFSRLFPLAGLIGSVFLVALGIFYLAQHRPVEGYSQEQANKMQQPGCGVK